MKNNFKSGLQKALDDGCGRIVVILTRPRNEPADFKADRAGARRIRRKYPAAAEDLLRRADRYNEGVAFALRHKLEVAASAGAENSKGATAFVLRS